MTIDSRPVAAPMSESEQRGFVVFATWIIAGLFLDGWSHQVDRPEDFFTPYHLLMYSGFGAAVLFGIALGRREESSSTGDRLTAVGVGLFAAGMVGDFAWHEIFGIEVDVEALLSPTHLLLMSGGLLLASAPARSALMWARSSKSRRPEASFSVVWSITATFAVVAFFLQFASAFRGNEVVDWVRLSGMDGAGELNAIRGVMAILLTNLLFVGAATILVSNWNTRPGHLSLMLGTVAFGVSALTGFDHAELILAAVAGGALADIAVAKGRPEWVPVAIPLAMWPVWTALLSITATFGWSQNVWGGAIFLSIVSGFGVKVLSAGSFEAS